MSSQIIHDIFNEKLDKHYKRIGSGRNTFICGQKIPYSNINIYDSTEILKKANDLYDYTLENCGMHIEYNVNGKIKIEYFHNNGVKEGIYKEYDFYGNLIREHNYVNNKLNGITRHYKPTGELTIEVTYKEDKIHGIYNEYNINSGYIFRRYNYNEGEKEGEYIEEKTDYIINGIYENNTIVEMICTNKTTGIIIEKRYKHINYNENNLICGETHYESGKIKEIYYMHLNCNHDKYIKYYESGQKHIECTYYNNTYRNDYIVYHESGRLQKYTKFDSNIGALIESISYYDHDVNNISEKKSGKTYQFFKDDGILHKFEYSDSPNIVIKYSIESHYYEQNKQTHKEILRNFALDLLKSLE